RWFVKWTAIIVAVVVFLSVIGNALGIVNVFWQAKRAKLTAQPRVTSKVYETENIIAQVNRFHERCTGVQEKLAIFKNNYAKYVADKEAAHLKTDTLEQHAAVEALAP